MKTGLSFLAPAILAICLFQPSIAESESADTKISDDQRRRQILRYTLAFEECVHLTVDECEVIIDKMLEDNPRIFMEHSLHYEVEKLQQPGDYNYHWIGLMTNNAGTHVAGHDGDGIVKYYNPDFNREPIWCISNEPCPDNHNRLLHINDKCCFNIGPWDCDTGVPKTVEECCNMIKTSVPGVDLNGNEIHCHTAYPLGSDMRPIDYTRVSILLDSNDRVVTPPLIE